MYSAIDTNEKLHKRVYSPEQALQNPTQFFAEWFSELSQTRELAWRLTVRDFKALYRQSFAGYLWAFIPPLFASLTFILLQSGNVMEFGDTKIPYPAFVIVGTVLWQVFVDALNNPIRVTQGSRSMLVKINFPRDALMFSAIQMSLINLGIRLLILIPVLAYYQLKISPLTLLAPLGCIALITLGSALGLFFATASLLYQDFQRGLQVITTLWMFLTPVVYPQNREGIAGKIININPVTPIITTTRDWLTGVPASNSTLFFLVFAIAFIILALASFTNRLILPRIIERLGM